MVKIDLFKKRQKSLMLFCILFALPFTSQLLLFENGTAESFDAVLPYEYYTAIVYDYTFDTDYKLHWSYTSSASCQLMVLLFDLENFYLVSNIFTLDFSDNLANYTVLSDTSSYSAFGTYSIPTKTNYVFVIYNNDVTCNGLLNATYVQYNVNVIDTIPDPPIAMILSITIFGLMVLVVISLLIWSRYKSKRLEAKGEEKSKPISTKQPKIKLKNKQSKTFLCAACGGKIHAGSEKCSHCKEDIFCSVCKLKIDADDAIYKCPYCSCIGHTEHFLEWLNVKNNCPKCQEKLTPEKLIQMKTNKAKNN